MITLSSDFGWPYPAAMKGVLLSRTDARLVDVTHDFPRQDVSGTAFWLREVLPHFPPTVHLVVVDPGVGTQRKALVVRAGDHALIGPDNGVLLPVARALVANEDEGDEGDKRDSTGGEGVEVFTWEVENPASHTFHGRDVFAPAAAAVHEAGVANTETLDRASPTTDYVDLSFPDPEVNEGEDGRGNGGEATGEVLVIDGFGNVITNLPGTLLDGYFSEEVSINGESSPVERTYAAVGVGDRVVTVGSHAFVECAVNRGRGDDAFDLDVGRSVHLAW